MESTLKDLENRRSIRSYKPEQIKEEDLQKTSHSRLKTCQCISSQSRHYKQDCHTAEGRNHAVLQGTEIMHLLKGFFVTLQRKLIEQL